MWDINEAWLSHVCISPGIKMMSSIWLSWVDDNRIVEPRQNMKDEGKKLSKEIEIEDVGKLKEFVGCKVEIDNSKQSAKFTKPAMIQSFLDEFGAGKKKYTNRTGHSFKRAKPGKILASKDKSKYRSEIEKMMHMMRWSRPDIYDMTHTCT